MAFCYNKNALPFALLIAILMIGAVVLDAFSDDSNVTGQISLKNMLKKIKKQAQAAQPPLPPQPIQPACIDSDNTPFTSTPGGGSYNPPGQDRYVAGTVTYGQQKYEDYCANQIFYKDSAGNNLVKYDKTTKGAYIIEMGCIDGKTPQETTPFKCLGECQNGACLKPFQQPLPPTTEQPTQATNPTPTQPQQQTTQLKQITTKPQAKLAGLTVEKTQTVVLPQEVGV